MEGLRENAEWPRYLPSGCRRLLVTLEDPQHEKAGPPLSVPGDEFLALFSRDWSIELLERRDILAEEQRPGQERRASLESPDVATARRWWPRQIPSAD